MSFAEKSYTHGVDLVDIGPDGLRDVKQLRYTPQHPLTVIPDDNEPADLTINRLCRLIDERLPPLTAESADENAVYVALRVTHGKISTDDIAVAEKHIARRNAILCKIQKIMPPPDIDTERESINPATIDDILNLDPVEVLPKHSRSSMALPCRNASARCCQKSPPMPKTTPSYEIHQT